MAIGSVPGERGGMTRSRVPFAVVVAVLVTLPYAGLKLSWLAGGRAGILDAEFASGPAMWGLNAATFGLDATLVALVALLVADRRRGPAWLVLVPAWVATGLLLPVTVAVAVTVPRGTLTDVGPDSPLAGWVYGVVYPSLAAQAIVLGVAFVVHSRRRWPAVWSARTWPATVVLWCASSVLASWSAYALVLVVAPVDLDPGGPASRYLLGVTLGLALAGLGVRIAGHALRSTSNHGGPREPEPGAHRVG